MCHMRSGGFWKLKCDYEPITRARPRDRFLMRMHVWVSSLCYMIVYYWYWMTDLHKRRGRRQRRKLLHRLVRSRLR